MFGLADLHLWNTMLKNIIQTNIISLESEGTRWADGDTVSNPTSDYRFEIACVLYQNTVGWR